MVSGTTAPRAAYAVSRGDATGPRVVAVRVTRAGTTAAFVAWLLLAGTSTAVAASAPAPAPAGASAPAPAGASAALTTAHAFRGDATRSGVYRAEDAPRRGALRWKFATGGKVYSSPAVVDGRVYVGSADGHLYALDSATGELRWKFATEGRVNSSPAVAGDRVYFGSFDGAFYAVNAADGSLAWKFATLGERRFTAKHLHGALPAGESMPDPFDVFLSSPAVVADVVYFGSGDGHVYALDARTGELRWKFATGDVVHASPTVVDGVVYVGSWDSWFYALDARTGAQRWRFKTGEDPRIHNQVGIQSSAVVRDGIVYFGCRDSKLYALDAATGALRFAYDNRGSWVVGTPLVADGRVYFGTSDSGLLHSLDARSGAPAWKRSRNKWPMFSSPVLAGERLYVGTHEGRLLAIERASGEVAWAFATDGAERNGPRYTAPDGTPDYAAAYASAFYDDIVVGLDRLLSVGAVVSTPALQRGVAYFGSTDGNVYAVE